MGGPPVARREAQGGERDVSARLVRRIAAAFGIALVLVVAYLCFLPVPVEPVSWAAQTPPGYVGAHAPNTNLTGLNLIDLGEDFGPEHLAIGPDGKLYAAMTSGALVRMAPDGGNREVIANTGGRVLGFDFDAGGRMIAADAMLGLLAIASDGSVTRFHRLRQFHCRRAGRDGLFHPVVHPLCAVGLGRHARCNRSRRGPVRRCRGRPHLVHHPHDLVPDDDRPLVGRQLAVHDVKVGAAHAARLRP